MTSRSQNVPIMLKKVPIIPGFFSSSLTVSSVSTAPQLLRFPQGGLAMILHFPTKSEALGDFSLFNKETTRNVDFLAGLLGILWLTSRAVKSCWATTTASTRPTIARFYAAAQTSS